MMTSTIPDDRLIRMAVNLACRAPSIHNSQPWRWRYADGVLDLHTDRRQRLASADLSGRQLVISCGAALNHLETAMQALKWSTQIDRLPDPAHPGHLARIRFRPGAEPRSHDFDLLDAIHHRHSDRRPFGPVRSPFPSTLLAAADRLGVEVTVLPDDARPVLARATEMTAAARRYDSQYQGELRWWTRHSVDRRGIPATALATSDQRDRVAFGRQFPAGQDAGSAADVDRSTVFALSTPGDDRLDWLRSGEALSAVLLEAAADELSTCPLTHMTEMAASRELIRGLLDDNGHPQALIRIGVTERDRAAHQTPRLPIQAVLDIAGE